MQANTRHTYAQLPAGPGPAGCRLPNSREAPRTSWVSAGPRGAARASNLAGGGELCEGGPRAAKKEVSKEGGTAVSAGYWRDSQEFDFDERITEAGDC